MGEAYFYHLTHSALDATLSSLIGRALGAGWRVAVRGRDAGQLARLDDRLWVDTPESFVPHGLAGGLHDADQPVLLTTQSGQPNGAGCVMAIGGADITADEVQALDRVCVIFDGGDPDALATARGQWKALTGAGVKAKYWSEESGSWAMKAESRAPEA